MAAAKEGARFPSVSCADVTFAKVEVSLDTSGQPKYSKGTALSGREYSPIVYVETSFGAKRDASMASYRVGPSCRWSIMSVRGCGKEKPSRGAVGCRRCDKAQGFNFCSCAAKRRTGQKAKV